MMDCASTYTSTSSLQDQQQPHLEAQTTEATRTEEIMPFFVPFPTSSSTALMGSTPTHMASLDAEPLYLTEYGDCHNNSSNTVGALHQAWQQASGMSHLLDDFVQDWIPHAAFDNTALSQDAVMASLWQDQSLRGMLNLILTDEDQQVTTTSPTNMVPM